jgi:hypothetical protein
LFFCRVLWSKVDMWFDSNDCHSIWSVSSLHCPPALEHLIYMTPVKFFWSAYIMWQWQLCCSSNPDIPPTLCFCKEESPTTHNRYLLLSMS